ncbi:MAG: DUF58 domain-containing protein [Polyangiaceae bacterium]|nr:DUF58 domain-containing protein [Polyangiaceae bacterium]
MPNPLPELPREEASTSASSVPSPLRRAFRQLGKWLRPPRRLKLTREGRYFVLITFFVGFAAINTGNNLLYLMLGMLLSLIIVSGVLSEISLRHLTVVRKLPQRAQVGKPHLVEIEVFNEKQGLPSYAIEVEDLRAGQPADKRCFFLKISPKSTQVAAYRRTPGRRGFDHHVGFRIATRFPFGLFEKSREIEVEGTLLVYPAVDPVRLAPEVQGRQRGASQADGRGRGDEVFGIRPMREGDDPRDIYWRRSVLPQQVILKERSGTNRRQVVLKLDSIRPKLTGSDDWGQRFELRIRDVASRAVAELKRGNDVLVRTSAGAQVRSTPSQGSDPVLRFLAVLTATPEDEQHPARRSSSAPARDNPELSAPVAKERVA